MSLIDRMSQAAKQAAKQVATPRPAPAPVTAPGSAPTFKQVCGATKFMPSSQNSELLDLAARLATLEPMLDGSGRFAAHVNDGALDGVDLRAMQRFLNANGAKVTEDGKYGPGTHKALTEYLVKNEDPDSP